jgi:hypothetical protein
MFDCSPRSGSLKVRRVLPFDFTWASALALTEPAPQTIGTNSVFLAAVELLGPFQGQDTVKCCADAHVRHSSRSDRSR